MRKDQTQNSWLIITLFKCFPQIGCLCCLRYITSKKGESEIQIRIKIYIRFVFLSFTTRIKPLKREVWRKSFFTSKISVIRGEWRIKQKKYLTLKSLLYIKIDVSSFGTTTSLFHFKRFSMLKHVSNEILS